MNRNACWPSEPVAKLTTEENQKRATPRYCWASLFHFVDGYRISHLN